MATSPLEVHQIQTAIREEGIDGWLLYDFRGRNPVAQRLVRLRPKMATRRWYYFIPPKGECVAIVHDIEKSTLDHLPGKKILYRSWPSLHNALKETLKAAEVIAMEHSPENENPYLSLVDGGTIQLIQHCGVLIVSSGDLVQLFEARWTAAQLLSHRDAVNALSKIKEKTIQFVKESFASERPVSEYDVQQFIWQQFERNNLTADYPPIVAVNSNASDVHYVPEKDASSMIAKGDLMQLDIWGKLKQPRSIYADVTAVCSGSSKTSEKHEQIFQIVRTAQMLVFDFLQSNFRKGKATFGWEADDVARRYITEKGFGEYFIHRTGHSLGQELHGNGAHLDNYETREQRKLIVGTGFTISPGIYLNTFGIHCVCNVFLSNEGPVITTPEESGIVPLLQ